MTIQPEVLKTLRLDSLRKINEGKKRTHAFMADFSEINKEFVGKIIFHYPSQMEKLRIGVTKSALLGGNMNVDVMTDNIAHITATLDTVLDFRPDWFDIDNPELEYEILEAVYMEYVGWVDSFRRPDNTSETVGDSTGDRSEVSVVDTEDVPGTTNRQPISKSN